MLCVCAQLHVAELEQLISCTTDDLEQQAGEIAQLEAASLALAQENERLARFVESVPPAVCAQVGEFS